jgi:hypothetical protein
MFKQLQLLFHMLYTADIMFERLRLASISHTLYYPIYTPSIVLPLQYNSDIQAWRSGMPFLEGEDKGIEYRVARASIVES